MKNQRKNPVTRNVVFAFVSLIAALSVISIWAFLSTGSFTDHLRIFSDQLLPKSLIASEIVRDANRIQVSVLRIVVEKDVAELMRLQKV